MKTPKETLIPTRIDEVRDFEKLREYLKQLLEYLQEHHINVYEDLKTLFEKTGA